MNETRLRGASIADSVIDRLNAPVLRAANSSLRDVEITGSRIASAEFHGTSWRSVRFTGCKLGYLNLRGAEIHDLLITDCTIEELDVSDAKLTRAACERTRIDTLIAAHAALTDVDLRDASLRRIDGIQGLRGATMSSSQIADLAEVFAEMLGIHTTP
ncbi:pentapeptide repeat-containing protein [Microbacterium sp. NPDC077663]|uniref:pentapeptide repeat-containing protein n=1 Tax=Microbacterium sp. NPDC077663 TaxID=3364189 RepID=UPI0037C79510